MTAPRTLLQITDKGPGQGGIARVVAQHAALATAHGWNVRRLRLVSGAARPAPGLSDMLAPVELARHLPATSELLQRLEAALAGVDVVHLHLGFDSLAPDVVRHAAARAPLIVHLHDTAPFKPPRPRTLREGLARRVLRPIRRAAWAAVRSEASCVVAPSRFLLDAAVETGLPRARTALVHHGIAIPDTAPAPPSARPPVVLYAGLLSRAKGAPLLLDAFAKLDVPAARLRFLGDGPDAGAMRARASAPDLAGRVQFLNRVAPSDVARHMSEAKVTAFPTLLDEGLGLSGVEALAQGCPVAGFARGGAAEWLIDGQTGLVAQAATPEALADAMTQLLSDGALADRLAATGRALVAREFSEARMIAALDGLFVRLTKGQAA